MSEASELINTLKELALNSFNSAATRADNLNAASYQTYPFTKITQGYEDVPSIGVSMPSAPIADSMVYDHGMAMTQVGQLVDGLETSWLMRYFPATMPDGDELLFESMFDSLNDNAVAIFDRAALDLASPSLLPQDEALVSAAMQELLWERAKEQAQRDAMRAEDDAVSQWAARGFSLPGGVVAQQLHQISQAQIHVNASLAAQQAIKALEISVEARRLQYEELRAQVEVLRLQSEAYNAYADTQLKALGVQAKALEVRMEAVKFNAETSLRLRLGLIQGLTGLITAYVSYPRVATEYAASISNARRTAQQAVIEYYRAMFVNAEMTIRPNIVNAENALKHVQLMADYAGRFGANQVAARVAGVDTFAKTAASALAGLNGVASVVNQTIE